LRAAGLVPAVSAQRPPGQARRLAWLQYSFTDCLAAIFLLTRTTSQARPAFSINQTLIQVTSNSHHLWPWEALRGWAWWLLCQPSPLLRMPIRMLFLLFSSVS